MLLAAAMILTDLWQRRPGAEAPTINTPLGPVSGVLTTVGAATAG